MTKLLSALILSAFATVAVTAQAASHAGAAPMKASEPAKKDASKHDKKDEKKEAKPADKKASAPK